MKKHCHYRLFLPPDVDKTASGGNFIFLKDKFDIPKAYDTFKRFNKDV